MGVDTVVFSYDLHKFIDGPRRGGSLWVDDVVQELETVQCKPTKDGRQGVCHWVRMKHDTLDSEFTIKCVHNGPAVLMWEGSVQKLLALKGEVPAECVRVADRWIRQQPELRHLPAPDIRRVDLCADVEDHHGDLREAMKGWRPHARARYVEAEYVDPSTGGHTVWLHNKSRGVRAYDKFAETGRQEWAYGLTRIEYQVRHGWIEKLGLGRLYKDFASNCDAALAPLVQELCQRAGKEWRPQ